MDGTRNYRYLNREGRWLDFRWVGVELRPDGTLTLDSLPLLTGALPVALAGLEPDGPSGVAAVHGDVFFTDPSAHGLSSVDVCDATARPVPCLGGLGSGPGELRTPRGLLYHARRRALLVADSGNARVQVLALPDLRLEESWGAAGRFVEPVSLAADSAGNVYVADAGARVVRKLDLLGREIAGFAAWVGSYDDLAPAEVAVAPGAGGAERVYVLDADNARVHVLDLDGHREGHWATGLERPMGLAAVGANVYVGDNATRGLVVFTHDGERLGVAHGYVGPVCAVTADGRGALLVHAGDGVAPLSLSLQGAFGTRGVLWGGPFVNPSDRSDPRHWIRARFSSRDANAYHQVFVLTQPAGGPRPPVDPDAVEPFAGPDWQPVAPDATETLVQGAFGDEVWLGLVFTGESLSSPALEQIRIDFDHETLLQYLPALYVREAESADLLARWLTLFESMFDGTQTGIDGLPLLFDPAAVPADWLAWLAGWLALELPETWSEGERRRAIAEAFERAARRGTVDGLRETIESEAGLDVLIEEPIVRTGWWALAEDGAPTAQSALSVLGVGTVLAAAEPQGAVVGTTAVLDGSFVSPQDEYARPLFAEVAHRFTARLYRGHRYSESAAAIVRDVLERERPAHTTYHVCLVEPRMRVGVQARVGVDAVVAGPVEPTPLEDRGTTEVVLGGAPPGRLGVSTSVGQVRLTGSVRDR